MVQPSANRLDEAELVSRAHRVAAAIRHLLAGISRVALKGFGPLDTILLRQIERLGITGDSGGWSIRYGGIEHRGLRLDCALHHRASGSPNT